MTRTKRLLIASAVAGATALVSFSADAFFGPFNWFRNGGWGGPGWGGWGGPWDGYGYGYPYGWGGYPGWGYPGWGYPYGGWGSPYGGWGGYPYGLGYPLLTAPVVVSQPAATSSAK